VDLLGRPDARDVHKAAERIRGYYASHVARILRSDGQEFSVHELEALLTALQRFLSFVMGASVGLMNPRGYDEATNAVWTDLSVTIVDPVRPRLKWHDRHHPDQVQELFPKFMARWADELWRDVLRDAIGYYIEANDQGFVEKRLVMATAGLEMLAWTVIYETEDWIRHGELQRPRLSLLLRLLLRWAAVPTEVPVSLTSLAAYAPDGGPEPLDGPQAIASVRNRIVHPRRGKSLPPSVEIDAWLLASHYLELAVLRVCDYGGSYADRLDRARYEGNVGQVPWHDR
jgi:hypothetical protein